MELAEVFQKLEDVSKRVTPQREHIIRIFADHPGQRFSAEEVRELMQQDRDEVGVATIYRTLELLTDLQILIRETVGDGRAHYYLPADRPGRPRPTMVCARCGTSERIPEERLFPIEVWALEAVDFEVEEYELTLYGICRSCHQRHHRRR